MKKILAIEDQPLFLEILQSRFLDEEEVEFSIALDAKEGLRKVKEKNPDLILLDIMLPQGISGVDILRKLKEDPKTENIPVIMLSGIDREEVIKETKKLGAADYIVKGSIPLKDLTRRIKKHLK